MYDTGSPPVPPETKVYKCRHCLFTILLGDVIFALFGHFTASIQLHSAQRWAMRTCRSSQSSHHPDQTIAGWCLRSDVHMCVHLGRARDLNGLPTIPVMSSTLHWLSALAKHLNTWHCFSSTADSIRILSSHDKNLHAPTAPTSPSPHSFRSPPLEIVAILNLIHFSASPPGTWPTML